MGAVDWYSVGALTYEMLTGLPPYYHKDRQILFQRIRKGELTYPVHVGPIAKTLLMGLLNRNPEKRLGGGPDSGEEVKRHDFFADVDWVKLDSKRYAAPWQPNVSASDVTYFDKEFLRQPVVNSEVGEVGRRRQALRGLHLRRREVKRGGRYGAA